MDQADYYELLGVSRDASQQEIKRAYRKRALKYHPDRNPHDPTAADKFKRAAHAFDILGDPEKRRLYDTYGEAGLRGAGVRSFTSFEDIFSAFSDIFSGSIFDEFFATATQRAARRGRSLRVRLEIELEEVARGVTKTVALRRRERCESCRGSGCAAGKGPVTCSYCRGYGQVESRQGFFALRTTCPHCHGSGTLIKDRCPGCGGSGLAEREIEVEIPIPAGIESATRLKVRDEGESGPDGLRGDLYCDVVIREHPIFHRRGADLICELPIAYPTAALGGEAEVPLLGGDTLQVRIPRGTQSGEALRLRGKGLPDPHGRGRGDLLVQVAVEVPRELTPRQEELLRDLAVIERANIPEKRKSFLERLRNYVHSMTHPLGNERTK